MQDARFGTAVDVGHTAVLHRELDRGEQPADVMHGEIDHQLAVGGAFDRRDVELPGREQIVEQIVARPVLVLGEIDDLVGIELVGRQRRLGDAVRHAVGEVGAVFRGDAALARVRTEHALRHVVLAHRDLLHVVGDGAGLEPFERHAAIHADRRNAGRHGGEVRVAMQHAGRGEQHVEVRLHHRLAHGGRRVVVVGGTALEQRDGRLGAELGAGRLHGLPHARVVREIGQDEDAMARLDVRDERRANVMHIAGDERSRRHWTSRNALAAQRRFAR